MPLYYVLLFLRGNLSWHYRLTLQDAVSVCEQTRLEQQTFYKYQLSICKSKFSPLFYA
jgi:hypothetical protein